MLTLDYVSENPWLIIIILLSVFGLIVLIVILIKKYSPHFRSEDKPKTDEEIAKEEVERLTVPMEEDNKNLEEVKAEERAIRKEEKPTEQEAAEYETHRLTVEGNEDLQRQMEEYSKAHPEEEAISPRDLKIDDDK